jgi:hypothetical protein
MEISQPTLPSAYKRCDTVYMSQVNHSREFIGFYAYDIKWYAYRETNLPSQPKVAVFIIKPKIKS